ncbi:nitroreductase family protein [Polynucleobacter sphagniphilus]|uniref:Putative NAD(P)H nitroreductase n=1 Tax=Polynucleobacter sphagniphilus TaxID=1743169 RepID=A0AA43S6G5_9BURK|nr:nitroreductase family protein [Polynucleobacter sphagniphilus]MDH6503801.1 nitroreductase [Polynucleobacter sphagniphilus]MDH6513405.1 nitroreductase [Polynucleobacter sphagniphilus]
MIIPALVTLAFKNEVGNVNDLAKTFIHSRQHISPKRLVTPGPSPEQKAEIISAASAAPDHGRITPWHFYEVSEASRQLLGAVFADALIERDASASPAQILEAKEKAFRGSLLFLATIKLDNRLDAIPKQEKIISAGCAIQNMLLMANALGFGSGLSSGKALYSEKLRNLFSLQTEEEPLCFITIGTIASHKPIVERPNVSQYSSIF